MALRTSRITDFELVLLSRFTTNSQALERAAGSKAASEERRVLERDIGDTAPVHCEQVDRRRREQALEGTPVYATPS